MEKKTKRGPSPFLFNPLHNLYLLLGQAVKIVRHLINLSLQLFYLRQALSTFKIILVFSNGNDAVNDGDKVI